MFWSGLDIFSLKILVRGLGTPNSSVSQASASIFASRSFFSRLKRDSRLIITVMRT